MQRHKEEEQLPLLSNTKPVTYALGYLNSPEIAEQHASVFKQFFAFLELEGKYLDAASDIYDVMINNAKEVFQTHREGLIKYLPGCFPLYKTNIELFHRFVGMVQYLIDENEDKGEKPEKVKSEASRIKKKDFENLRANIENKIRSNPQA